MSVLTDLFGLSLRGHYDLADEAEAESNQRGELTDKQRDWMRYVIRQKAYGAFGSLVVVALFGPFFLCFLTAQLNAYGLSQPIAFVVPALLGILVIAFLTSTLRGLAAIVRTWSELSTGKVVQAAGQVLWKGGGYAAQVAGHQVNPLDKRSNLLPGDYRFYYLPRSGWLLSARKLFTFDERHADMDLMNTLAHAIGFNQATLGANRQGQMTRGELLAIIGSVLSGSIIYILIAVGMTIVTVLTLLRGEMLGGLILVMLTVVLLNYTLKPWAALIPDILARKIAVAEGIGKRFSYVAGGGGKGRSTRYEYSIGNQIFRVPLPAYNALVEGVQYRLYYLPRSKRVLSVEPLETQTQTSAVPL